MSGAFIDGLKVHVKAEEIREIAENAIGRHSEKADYYQKRADSDKAEEELVNVSNSGRSQYETLAKNHRHRAAYFKFLAEHVVDGVTYILDKDDLAALEITSGY